MTTKTKSTRATPKPVEIVMTTPKPVEPKATPAPAKLPVSRHVAALKAHRTMTQKMLTGLRGKKRAELVAKIADYDRQIAAAA